MSIINTFEVNRINKLAEKMAKKKKENKYQTVLCVAGSRI